MKRSFQTQNVGIQFLRKAKRSHLIFPPCIYPDITLFNTEDAHSPNGEIETSGFRCEIPHDAYTWAVSDRAPSLGMRRFLGVASSNHFFYIDMVPLLTLGVEFLRETTFKGTNYKNLKTVDFRKCA